MPIVYKISSPEKQRLAVWEITEDETMLAVHLNLNETEQEIVSGFKNKTRRLQWLAVRNLLKEFHPVRPVIDYTPEGKPFLVNHNDNISISHSGKYAAIILNRDYHTGIDIEEINHRILKIAERFTNELERSYLKNETLVEQLCIIWGAKEVLFKMLHISNISFKENFRIEPFIISMDGILNAAIVKHGNETPITMKYLKIGNYVLVYMEP